MLKKKIDAIWTCLTAELPGNRVVLIAQSGIKVTLVYFHFDYYEVNSLSNGADGMKGGYSQIHV